MRPPTLGYFRVLPGPPDEEVKLLRDEIAAYAEREGFTLSEVYMDHDKSQASGFSALVDALERDDARYVVVPALHHFARFPGMRLAIKEMLERKTGASVLVMHTRGRG